MNAYAVVSGGGDGTSHSRRFSGGILVAIMWNLEQCRAVDTAPEVFPRAGAGGWLRRTGNASTSF